MQETIDTHNEILHNFCNTARHLIVNVKEKKTINETDGLINYIGTLESRLERINYEVSITQKNASISEVHKNEIKNVVPLLEKRLQLEIDNLNNKSTEVSLNILNSTLGTLGEVLKRTIKNIRM